MKELIECLNEMRDLICKSEDGCWNGLSPAELVMNIDLIVEQLSKGGKFNKTLLTDLVAPTSSGQDLAIDNGWGNMHLKLSEKIENLAANKAVNWTP